MRKFRIITILAVMLVGLFGATTTAFAGEPFLCPVVGDGVITADENNGENGVSSIDPPVGTSLLPGNNQAGANSNPNAHNPEGPGNPDAGPGGNPDYSPIWPG